MLSAAPISGGSYTLLLLTAPADGVAPAVLLAVRDGRRSVQAQYLFNIPEALARLLLEHRVRPGLHFKAAFATGLGPAALGGLGGLLLRLKQDGHGRMQLVGPTGTEACLEALRGFVRWQHPTVGVTEAGSTDRQEPNSCNNSTVYEDRWLQVCVIADGGRGSAPIDWQAPEWLKAASSSGGSILPGGVRAAVGRATGGGGGGSEDSSSGSDSDSSSSGDSSSAEVQGLGSAGVSTDADDSQPRSSSGSSSSEESQDGSSDSGDTSSGSTSSSDSDSSSSDDSGSMSSSSVSESSSGDSDVEQQAPPTEQHTPGKRPPPCGQAPAAARLAAKRARSSEAFAALDGIFSGGGGEGSSPATRLLALQALRQGREQDKQQQQQAGRAVKSTKQTATPADQQPTDAPAQLLGFICHLPGVPTAANGVPAPSAESNIGALIAVLCCPHELRLPALQEHPAIAALADAAVRVQAVLHLTPPAVAATASYRRWIQTLPGRQVLVEGSGAGGVTAEAIGFRAAARLSARLGLISSGLFPLPAAARSGADDADDSVAGLLAEALVAGSSADGAACAADPKGEGDAVPPAADEPAPAVVRQLAPDEVVEGALLLQLTGPACDEVALPGDCTPALDPASVRRALLTDRPALAPALMCSREQRPALEAAAVLQTLLGGVVCADSGGDGGDQGAGGQQQHAQQPSCWGMQGPVVWPCGVQPMQWAPGWGPAPVPGWGAPAWGAAPWGFQPLLHAPPPPRPPPGSPPKPVARAPLRVGLGAGSSADGVHAGAQEGQTQLCAPKCGCADPDAAGEGGSRGNRAVAAQLRARLRGGPAAQELTTSEGSPPSAPAAAVGPAAASPAVAVPESPVPAPADAALAAAVKADADDEPPLPLLSCPWAAGTGVVLLGTGSAEPSKYRGPSGVLLRVAGVGGSAAAAGWVLLDCGEGVWGQVVRLAGAEAAQQLAASLVCVWVSHRHADHMLGLPGILSARPASAPPLLIAGPPEAHRWLAALARYHPTWRYELLPLHSFSGGAGGHVAGQRGAVSSVAAAAAAAAMSGRLGFVAWRSVAVDHCAGAYGLVLEHSQGWKIVYSGDTRPCDALVRAGAGATLLIHEATFEPDLSAHAIRKRHSTSSEAVAVGARMGAYRTLLTHFSQRYPKLPGGLDASARCWRRRPLLGFDGMVLPLSLLPQLPALTPLVAAALAEKDEEGAGMEGVGAEAGDGGPGGGEGCDCE